MAIRSNRNGCLFNVPDIVRIKIFHILTAGTISFVSLILSIIKVYPACYYGIYDGMAVSCICFLKRSRAITNRCWYYTKIYLFSQGENMVMKMIRFVSFAMIVLIAAVCFSGCTQTASSDTDNAPVQKITVSGAFALYPMMVKWAEEYQKIHPEVKIEISAGGAGKGMTDALTGMVDLGMVSRDISQDEIDRGAVYVAVTKDAVVPVANAQNPVILNLQERGIDKATFKKIFIDETVTTWGAMVNRPEVSDKINVYTRSDACGAADVWAKYLGYKQEDLKGVGVFGDPGLADAVKSDTLGIGYNNIAFAYDAKSGKPLDGLVIIPLDLNENGIIDPDEQIYATRDTITEAINTGKYPSPPARELNLVTRGTFSGPTQDFVSWILTDGQQYVQESGYIALPKEKISENMNKLSPR